MFWVYHSLANPVKENRKSFHLRVSCDMPDICKHEHTCSNSHRWMYGFSFSSPKKIWS
jgi:hypothetical protein